MANLTLSHEEARAGHLPRFCMRCGEPAEYDLRKGYSWNPPWMTVLIPLFGLIGVAIVLAARRRMVIDMPLCQEHHDRPTRTKWQVIIAALLGVGLMIAGAAGSEAAAEVGAAVAVTGAVLTVGALLVGLVVQNNRVRVQSMTDD